MDNTKTKIIHERFFDIVNKNVIKNERNIKLEIGKFLDFNSEALYSKNMGDYIIFNKILENKIWEYCGIQEEEMQLAIKDTKLTDKKWFQRNRAIYPLLMLMQKSFLKNKKIKEQRLILYFMTIILYSGRQKKFFQFVGSTSFDNCMEYTVNNLSNKFLLKQKGNIDGALDVTLETCLNTYKDLIKSDFDIDQLDFINYLLTRIHNLVKGIANLFYINNKSKKYFNYEKDTDEEGQLLDNSNLSAGVERISNNTYNKLKTDSMNLKAIRILARSNKIAESELMLLVENITKNETIHLKNIVTLLLTIFLSDNRQQEEDICSSKFILISLNTYSKSNTNEKNVLELKKVLEILLKKNSNLYTKTQRVATKINLKKAFFLYIASQVQEGVCG
jgi:hypothetical protein